MKKIKKQIETLSELIDAGLNNPDATGRCIDCGAAIKFSEVAEEIRKSSWDEIICQSCYDSE